MDKVRNWNDTVHYATNGVPACAPIRTHKSWLVPSIATVTCERCVTKFGADTPGLVDPPDEYTVRMETRAAELKARIAARRART